MFGVRPPLLSKQKKARPLGRALQKRDVLLALVLLPLMLMLAALGAGALVAIRNMKYDLRGRFEIGCSGVQLVEHERRPSQ
jgi:hypothetical protein